MPTRRPARAAALVAAAALALAGCASSGGDQDRTPSPQTATVAPGATSAGTAGGSPTGDVRTVEVTITGQQVDPPPAQVDLAVGETLRLVVTSDRDSEVHAHGFEVEAPVPAGVPTTVELTGSAPGVYEVELHDPDLLLLQVAVR